jgi:hypothetical protein
MWSTPHCITKQIANSYQLETLDSVKLEGVFSAQRLRKFIPREGMDLAEVQKEYMKQVTEKEKEWVEKEKEEVDKIQRIEKDLNEIHKVFENSEFGLLYEEDEEISEEEDIGTEEGGIAERVVRRRGHCH